MLLTLLACATSTSTDSSPGGRDTSADTGDTAADTGDTAADTGDTGADTGADTGDTGDTSDTGDTGVAEGCRAAPRGADLDRALVVSFPYSRSGGAATAWEVLTLEVSGTISRPGTTFQMGRGYAGVVAFSPDGTLGVAPQDDGTLGIFTVDGKLVPHVVEAAWAGDSGDAFYASAVVFDASGERAWIVDGNWENNGGGLYEVAFDCETGAPTLIGRTIASELAVALLPLGDGAAVLVAAGADGQEGGDVWLLEGWPDAPTVADSAVLFAYDDAILGSAAQVGDAVLVGDNSAFSGQDNRVVGVQVGGGGLGPVGNDTVVLDPFAIAASPWGDAALVSSGFGDALYVLSVTDGVVTRSRELDASGVALPGSSVVVTRGALAGAAFVVENLGVRRVAFDGAGGAADLGLTTFGEGYADIPGAIGLQP